MSLGHLTQRVAVGLVWEACTGIFDALDWVKPDLQAAGSGPSTVLFLSKNSFQKCAALNQV